MRSITNSCGTTAYTWDARNRLVTIEGFDDACQPLSASFKYDALGRRIEKTINGRTIQYLYDGLDIVQEVEDGMVTVNYIRILNIDEPLARIKSDGTIRYYHADALGSIIALTDETGQIRTQYNYSPFGETEIIGEPSDNPFQYTGRENDGTGLYYYRARYYSPRLKRFVSEDPIGFDGGVNFYVYAGNNTLNLKDSLGLFYCDTVTEWHKQCLKLPTDKKRCECHCVYATDMAGCIDACMECFSSNKPLTPYELCICACKKTNIGNCDSLCKGATK